MGLGHSKTHPQVIKVTPLQSQEAKTPSTCPVFFALNRNLEEKSSYSFTRLQEQNRTLEQLPPLRETWYGRLPAVSRAVYLDIPLKHEETSIIKRHPPRRIQKLEPIDLPQAITSERLLCQQKASTKPSPKAQMELRRSLLSKAMRDMQKLKDHDGNKITQSKARSNGYEVLIIPPDENIYRDPDLENAQDEEFLDYLTEDDYFVRNTGKVETWLRAQEAQGRFFWNSSSSDSGELEKEERRPQALVRTKTEKIPLYDDFYDSA
ncbi:factor associated with metabolism and energy isoform X7 [Rattus norvegicus]|uniref:factor associated with metabolism and energy isoform X7 n=1 Tax=Rattus norvegicus TaxID=10116 RepID=UPI002FD823C2